MIIAPEDVTTFYWRPLDEDGTTLLAMEISVDDGLNWTLMSVGQNEDGDDANQWTFAGFAVDPTEAAARADTMILGAARLWFYVRIVDNPEIEAERSFIDCRW